MSSRKIVPGFVLMNRSRYWSTISLIHWTAVKLHIAPVNITHGTFKYKQGRKGCVKSGHSQNHNDVSRHPRLYVGVIGFSKHSFLIKWDYGTPMKSMHKNFFDRVFF